MAEVEADYAEGGIGEGEEGVQQEYAEESAQQEYAEGEYAHAEGEYAEGQYYAQGGEYEQGIAEGEPGSSEMPQGGVPLEDEEVIEQPKKRGGHGRRKIEIEYIDDKIRRHITFSKRKAGISKKAYELSRLTGAQVLLLISSERGQIYSFATPKLQPILVNEASKTLIEQCLNAPDPIAPLALGMPGMPQAMMPIDGQVDPNDPNAQQQYAEYAEGQYQGQQADADQLLAMQQAAYQQGMQQAGEYQQEQQQYYEGQEQYAEYQEGQEQYQEGYDQQQYAEGYEQHEYHVGYEQQEGYGEPQEGEEQHEDVVEQ